MSNFVHTTPEGLGATFIVDVGKGGTESVSPTNTDWFKWFMRGCHRYLIRHLPAFRNCFVARRFWRVIRSCLKGVLRVEIVNGVGSC
jgi:hypothetical protein